MKELDVVRLKRARIYVPVDLPRGLTGTIVNAPANVSGAPEVTVEFCDSNGVGLLVELPIDDLELVKP